MSSPSRMYSTDGPDLYNTVIVDDLLRGASDWRNIQDIVRLTFKALAEVVKAQGNSIRELERQMPSRVTKVEFHSGLAQKADYAQVSEQFADFRLQLDNRTAILDLQSRLEDKVSHSELSYYLSSKAPLQEVSILKENQSRELQATVSDFYSRIDHLQSELAHQIKQTASIRDFQALSTQVKQKANLAELQDAITFSEEKMANTLQKKAGKIDLENALARKADSLQMQRVLAALESKAQYEWVEQISQILDEKLDIAQMEYKYVPEIRKKADQAALDPIYEQIKVVQVSSEGALVQKMAQTGQNFAKVQQKLDQMKKQTEKTLQTKADKSDLEQAVVLIHQKADQQEMAQTFKQHGNQFNRILSKKSLELQQSIQLTDQGLKQQLVSAYNKIQSLSNENKTLASNLSEFKEQHKQKGQQSHQLIKRMNTSTKTDLMSQIQIVTQQLQRLSRNIDQLQSKKSTRQELSELLKKTEQKLSTKAELSEVDRSMVSLNSELTAQISDTIQQTKTRFTRLQSQLQNKIEQRVTAKELEAYLAEKADLDLVTRVMESRAQVEQVRSLQKDIQRLFAQLKLRAFRDQLTSHIESTKLALQDVGKDMLMKANIKEICDYLGTKASVEDVNSALVEIHKELDTKANGQEINDHVTEQVLINEALCSENTVGRWIWKNGEVRKGYAVPWDIQSVNTCPENFLWEPQTTSIVIVAPGLYEVIFGFYSRKKPTVQLLVNGEPVLSAVNNSSYVIHHSSGRLKNVQGHSNGNIAGLTLIDFLALPARARLSVSYTGESRAEGFLGIRKLQVI